jgi:GTP-binding protein EngB required for normal cell division
MTQATLSNTRESVGDRHGPVRIATNDGLLAILASVDAIATREGSAELRWQIRDLHERVARDQFRIAVVGQFKRGKTSLLNALLGEPDLLPVGALPFTSILTIVQYGNEKAADVVFRSGRRLSISLTELKDFVTEDGNPNNCKMVEKVEVFYPGEILRGGISLVNSPGFGSLSDQNTQTAYGYLPRIDAAVFVTSPDPPLTAAEMAFLKKLTLSTRKLFVVMNKIDLLDPSSVSDVMEFTEKAITRIIGRPSAGLYAVSALRAGPSPQEHGGSSLSGLQRLESEIRAFLSTDRNEAFLASVRQCLLASLSELRGELESHIVSSTAVIEDLDRKRRALENEVNAVYDDYARNERALVEMVSRLADLAENETVRFAESKCADFDLLLRVFLRKNEELPNDQVPGALDTFAALEIEHLLDNWLKDLEGSLIRTFSDAIARFLGSANDGLTTIRERALEHFGVQISSGTIIECLRVVATPRGARPAFAEHGRHRAMRLIPRLLLRGWLLRHAQDRARRMLQQSGKTIGGDLNARTRVEIRGFAAIVRRRLQENIERIRTAVLAAQDQTTHSILFYRQRIVRLSADVRGLDQLTEMLNTAGEFQYALEA